MPMLTLEELEYLTESCEEDINASQERQKAILADSEKFGTHRYFPQ